MFEYLFSHTNKVMMFAIAESLSVSLKKKSRSAHSLVSQAV